MEGIGNGRVSRDGRHMSRRTTVSPLSRRAAFVALIAVLGFFGYCIAAEQPPADVLWKMDLPVGVRSWFDNPDGSCVQCSIGMSGVQSNHMQATTLLWNTPYGKAERGGSWPARVAEYCARRGIRAWNVTGSNTFEWMKWACKTGRFAAIGAGSSHFQTLYGWDPRTNTWYVCNNNSTSRVDDYTEQGFRNLHLASGRWVVVLKDPAPPAPHITEWWK